MSYAWKREVSALKDRTVAVRVPGTTANCGPGFDALGMACTIYNDLELTLYKDPRLCIEVEGEGVEAIPSDARNIAWKAAQLLLRRADAPFRGARMRMLNRIPLARGLGSSAAAIVAGLVAANAAIGAPFDRRALLQMATELEGHPDNVAPALYGGVTASVMADGRAETLSFLPARPLRLIVAVPDFNLSTKRARQALPEHVSLADAVFNVSRAAQLVAALCKGELRYLAHALEDRLHQPYRLPLVPGMQDVLAAARRAGAFGAALSGAGPCLIAFAEADAEEIGAAMVAAFVPHGVKARSLVLDIDEKGAEII